MYFSPLYSKFNLNGNDFSRNLTREFIDGCSQKNVDSLIEIKLEKHKTSGRKADFIGVKLKTEL